MRNIFIVSFAALAILSAGCGDVRKPKINPAEGKKFVEEFIKLRMAGDYDPLTKKYLSTKMLRRFTPEQSGILNEPIMREKLFHYNDPKISGYEISEGINDELAMGVRYGTVYRVKLNLKYNDGRDGGFIEEDVVVGKQDDLKKGEMVIDDFIIVQRQKK